MKNEIARVFNRSKITVALASIFFTGHVFANTIEGKVSDSSNSVYFEGTKLTIKELNRSIMSSRDGSFRFTNLPEGQFTLVADYIGANSVEQQITIKNGNVVNSHIILENQDTYIEDVIVVGQRAGQAGALNRQKNSMGIKSIVSSDSIGQLPDQNAAEALQRLPGMFIQRDQGEGRFVGIRGIDPGLNNVTINGANVPSPESGVRSVAMDVIPSELVQSLEVSKTVTPDMDANAIGGSIEVKSLSAFDREGQSYSFSSHVTHNEQVDSVSPKLSGSFTNTFELNGGLDLGIATALSWSKRKFGSHNIETDGGWQLLEVETSQGNDTEFFGPEEIEQRHYKIERERLGAALNLDLKGNDFSKYYLRSLYSKFSDDEFRLRNEYKFDKGALILDKNTNDSAVFSNAEMDRDTKDRNESQTILSFVLGAEHQFKLWFAEYSLGYSKSEEKEPNRIDTDFAGEEMELGFSNIGKVPRLNQDNNGHDLTLFKLDEIVLENNNTEDESVSFKLDLTRDFTISGYNTQFKFGGKYAQREKFNDVLTKVFDGGFNDTNAMQFKADRLHWNLGNFGPGLSRKSISDYYFQNYKNFDVNKIDSDIESKGKSFQSEENILAAYAMFKIDIGAWQVISGLRYEATDFYTSGNKVELINDEVNDEERLDVTPWENSMDYSHILPNLTVRYDFSDKLVTRFAYTKTLARPSFSDSAATLIVESERSNNEDGTIAIERKASAGNPNLEPYQSTNFDWSIEYYPGHIGVLSAGLFHKNIDNYIIEAEVQDNGNWDGYEQVIQSVNGGNAQLSGIELAYTKNFTNGLMLSINGTFINADDKLPNQSDTVANFLVGYENNTFSARLSASYKSQNFQFEENDARVTQDTHTQLDLSTNYYLNDQTQLYFNAKNLTDEPYYLFHGKRHYNYQYETYGRSFEFGITFNSL